MPRELITVQIGQCGMQLGTRFWDLALREHAANSHNATFDDALSSFFRNVDTRSTPHTEIPVGDGKGPIRALKARAVLVDMEEGVINEVMRGPMADLFDTECLVKDVSGSGNNWAHGHCHYGPMYEDQIMESVRKTTEPCDSLQSFFCMHSLGGGTGSGLGSYILHLLQDAYPHVYRFTTAVFPSDDDDVVTSPYNSTLCLNQLIEHSDCVLPVDNQALIDICARIDELKGKAGKIKANLLDEGKESKAKRAKAYADMNRIAAHVLTNLTASMRFEGSLNVDLNEISMNLVPYPRLHFLLSSLAPLYTLSDVKLQGRGLDQMFNEAFSSHNQLIKADPRRDRYLACGLMVRGKVQISDITRNIARVKPSLDFIHWNQEGFKMGLCSTPPVGQDYSLLCLSNNCCIKDTFTAIKTRVSKLYRRKAHFHHYTEYMDPQIMDDALENVTSIIDDYTALSSSSPPELPPRLTPVI
jgi:tubulin epsilon